MGARQLAFRGGGPCCPKCDAGISPMLRCRLKARHCSTNAFCSSGVEAASCRGALGARQRPRQLVARSVCAVSAVTALSCKNW